MKHILTIAGSDTGGGAGIQADLKTITALGGYGLTVVTALTAQNSQGVQGIWETPLDFIRRQFESVVFDMAVHGAKTGMLASEKIVRLAADLVAAHRIEGLVVDPVMKATSGGMLLAVPAIQAVKDHLLPLAQVATPNLPEAAILADISIDSDDDIRRAAQIIHDMGPRWVLIKGGHRHDRAIDILYDGRDFLTFDGPLLPTDRSHGSGCILSAALTTFLAQGNPPVKAVAQAKAFVTEAIQGGVVVGSGPGTANPAVHIQKILDKDRVLGDLRLALERLLEEPLGRLIPEIRSNFGYALPGATDHHDVAAVPGRITQIGDRLVAQYEPAFGASRHVAKVILAASRHDHRVRSAINIRYNESILAACREAGLSVGQFDRADEPREIKEKEGSTLEWGTGHAMEALDFTPDVIFDLGEKGKEPIIRVLGQTPLDVVKKLIKIGRLV